MTAVPGGAAGPPRLAATSPRHGEKAIFGLLAFCAFLSVAVTTAIVVSLLMPTIEFFGDVAITDFLFGTEFTPLFADGSFGVLPIVAGTFAVTFWALVVAVPVGIGSAIYLSEYASRRARSVLKPTLEVLAGIPTIAFGFFALTFITPLIQDVWPGFLGDKPGIFSALAAGIAVGIMIVPIIASISEDAMRAVPGGLREGAYALGATRMRVALRVVVPAALSGIVASVVLGISRAVGDDDRADRGRRNAQPDLQPGRVDPGHDRVHRYHGHRRRPDRRHEVQHHLRGRHAALRDYVPHEHDRHPTGAQVPRGVRVVEGRTEIAASGAAAATTATLGRQPRGDVIRGRLFQGALLAGIGLAVASIVALIADAFIEGGGRLSLDLIFAGGSGNPEEAGLLSALLGSAYMMACVIATVVPLGVGAAVYLEEFANKERWWNRLIELNIQNLAAVPSIVYGILGLAFIVRGPGNLGFILVAGAITLALLVLPTVILASREAIRAVPDSIRQGSLALGATLWQTVRRQVLPAAVPGIVTGVILAISRAIGETAPLLLVGATVFVTFNPTFFGSNGYTAMPVQIFQWVTRPQDEFRVLAAAAIIVLLVLLLAMNSFAIWLRNRYEQRW
jgi:phosphate ABC transporter permease subunit PstA/phosphate ABC transporter permease protein PstC